MSASSRRGAAQQNTEDEAAEKHSSMIGTATAGEKQRRHHADQRKALPQRIDVQVQQAAAPQQSRGTAAIRKPSDEIARANVR